MVFYLHMYVPVASQSSPSIAAPLPDSIGPKCLEGPSTRRPHDARIKSQLRIPDSIDMLHKLEESEAAISKIRGSISWEEMWPAHIQPMPHLRFNLAHGYLANGNWMIEALRRIVPVCLVSDPILFSSRSHPVPVGQLYMMLYILSQVIEQEERDEPGATTRVASLQLPIQSNPLNTIWGI